MAKRLPRRSVITSSPLRSGERLRLWAYGYADLAALLGTTEGAVRQLVRRGRLDPKDLRAVCEAWRAREDRPATPPPR